MTQRAMRRVLGGALAVLLVGMLAGALAGLLADSADRPVPRGDDEAGAGAGEESGAREEPGGDGDPSGDGEAEDEAAAGARDRPAGASAATGDRVAAAYVAYWDQQRGFDEVEANADLLTEVSPWWYGLTEAGDVVVQHEGVIDVDRDALDRLRARGLDVIPTIANHVEGSWTRRVSDVIRDPDLRAAHIDSVVALVEDEGYDGIDIDYEDLAAEDRDGFTAFVEGLGEALPDDKPLAVAVHPKTSPEGVDERNVAQDYAAIGRAADQVRVMAYDRHWAGSGPGPVAPIDWVRGVLEYATRQMPAERVVLGIGAFGYDWERGAGEAAELTTEEALALAEEHGAEIEWDDAAASPRFSYTDDDGGEHDVWFEDARSIRAKLRLVDELGLGGVFIWRTGGNPPATWEALGEARA